MKKFCTLLLAILFFSCIAPVKHDTVDVINKENYNRWFIEKADGRLGFIDSLGQEIFSDHFSWLGREYNSGLVPYAKAGKYIFLNTNYEYGFLNTNGEVVFRIEKYPTSDCKFSEGLLKVENNKKFVYLDTNGEIALSLDSLQLPKGKEIYEASKFSNGLARVIISDIGFEGSHNILDDLIVEESINMYPQKWHYGFIDKKGKWKIEPTLTSATIFQDNISLIVKKGTSYFMNTNGDIVLKIGKQYIDNHRMISCKAFDYSEGFAIISDIKDKVDVISYTYDYSEGFAIIFDRKGTNSKVDIIYRRDRTYTYINRKGKRISDLNFESAEPFSEGMACVKMNGKWGFIDTYGKLVIDFQYYVRSRFSEGLAPVSLKIKEKGYYCDTYYISGFIDKNGKVVIPFEPHIDYDGFKNGITKGQRFIYDHNKKYTGTYELFYMKKNGEKIWSEIIKG